MTETPRLADLEANARHTRDRLRLYRAKVYGSRPTSIAKLRELKRDAELAERLLSHARADGSSSTVTNRDDKLSSKAAGDS
jgi:hypothetical protein